jgi:hypothetical protein
MNERLRLPSLVRDPISGGMPLASKFVDPMCRCSVIVSVKEVLVSIIRAALVIGCHLTIDIFLISKMSISQVRTDFDIFRHFAATNSLHHDSQLHSSDGTSSCLHMLVHLKTSR